MDSHDIDRVVRDFGDAAYRCKMAGLDGIETLAGGHLIGQFFSPATNKRTDGYGGSIENRCKFGLEVYEEIRRRVGSGSSRGHRERFAPPSPRSTRHFMTQLGCRSKGPSESGAIAFDLDRAGEGRREIQTSEPLVPARATSPRLGLIGG